MDLLDRHKQQVTEDIMSITVTHSTSEQSCVTRTLVYKARGQKGEIFEKVSRDLIDKKITIFIKSGAHVVEQVIEAPQGLKGRAKYLQNTVSGAESNLLEKIDSTLPRHLPNWASLSQIT